MHSATFRCPGNNIHLEVDDWLLESKIISGYVPTCARLYSWELYSAAPVGDQVTSTMSTYPTPSHYPDTELTSPFPSLIMPSTRLASTEYQLLSYWFDSTRNWFPILQPARLELHRFGHRAELGGSGRRVVASNVIGGHAWSLPAPWDQLQGQSCMTTHDLRYNDMHSSIMSWRLLS